MSATTDDLLKCGDAQADSISGGHLVAKALRNEGIDTIFTLSGGNIVDIYDGCVSEGIRIIDFRHEQVAAHAADGYARQTGQTGCLVTTAGPGCCNAITGMATALRSETPLLHIGGQGATIQHLQGSLQEFDHVKLMSPVTKWATSVRSTERIADMVAMGCREAWGEVPGPVYLEIPRDLLDRSVDRKNCVIPASGHYRCSNRVMCAPEEIEKLADMLLHAEKPAVLFGSQVWNGRSHREALELIRALDMPAYTNGAARGIFRNDEPLSFDRTRNKALAEADLVMVVGTPFDFRLSYGKTVNPAAKVVQIDQNYAVIGKNHDITLGLLGHAGTIFRAVIDALSGRLEYGARSKRQAWIRELRQAEEKALEKLMPLFRSENSLINPYRVAYELNEFLGEDTIYIGDGGDVVTISAQAVRPRNPGQWMDPGPLGSLGVGTGFAIGAKLAHPGKEVVCYYGDGAFSMTAFDMETANRFHVPYLAVVGNNSAMNQIRYAQLAKYGDRGNVGNLLSDLPYGKFAEMMGGYGEEVHRPSDIAPALRRGREAIARTGKCAVINIWVDPQEWSPGTKARLKARMAGK
ncbi:thiamine pyrophosphate-binding protein [Oxalobacter sp. OxGP1]|uniref:thiamine pyrophosphate-binding protein n=1 Tax=Oxalobacter paeniformigenes TaxID=2946594 RepID=UPI0022AEFB93|nr:thiamine pyrophosphate-binding protein [Oxalobacter paeniformigenes]MCZ4053052.1 thiamine pyrophosphate-binding protein [Oxalobacter paeniformigenes]